MVWASQILWFCELVTGLQEWTWKDVHIIHYQSTNFQFLCSNIFVWLVCWEFDGDVHDQPSPKTAWPNLCEWSHNFWSENVTGCRGTQHLGLQSMKHLLQMQHAFPGFNSLLCLNSSRVFCLINFMPSMLVKTVFKGGWYTKTIWFSYAQLDTLAWFLKLYQKGSLTVTTVYVFSIWLFLFVSNLYCWFFDFEVSKKTINK